MPMFEDPQRIKAIEYEMACTWTRYRAGDLCRIIGGYDNLMGNEVYIKFPYYFPWEGEQTYITEQYVFPFKESELEFVRQKLYGYK